MVAAKLTRRARARLATTGLTVGVVAALAAPSAWAASVLDTRYGGSSFNASAGPAGGTGGAGGGGLLGATITLSASEQKLYDYVNAHRDGASYLMAVSSWTEASPFILSTGQEVMPMGGFSGSVPEPTPARVKELVRSGQLRFFLLNGTGSGAGFANGGSTAQTIASWVESTCRAVPAGDYGGTGTTGSGGTAGTLYMCGASA
jgi:4-amino-4-deoxy-L-arabinose transferase-like glycosyltransferase